jgi:hypothetical protein
LEEKNYEKVFVLSVFWRLADLFFPSEHKNKLNKVVISLTQ